MKLTENRLEVAGLDGGRAQESNLPNWVFANLNGFEARVGHRATILFLNNAGNQASIQLEFAPDFCLTSAFKPDFQPSRGSA